MSWFADSFFVSWLLATWDVMALSAYWLIAGFFFAGIIHVLLPTGVIQRHLQKPGIASVLKASAFGIPLPLCSCSVIPVGVSLRKQGASRGATGSFFISTPEIGVDSFLLSYVLLGPLFAVARVIASFVAAVLTGCLIDLTKEDTKDRGADSTANSESCCHKNGERETANVSMFEKLKQSIRYGFGDVLDDLSVSLIVGFLLAGLVTVLLPLDAFEAVGLGNVSAMLLMLVLSLPVYVCATSLTPLAAALIVKGLNPGAALVFLLAGPATNIVTMIVVRNELGSRALGIYLGSIGLTALLSGYLLDSFFSIETFIANPATHDHQSATLMSFLAGLILVALLLRSMLKKVRA